MMGDSGELVVAGRPRLVPDRRAWRIALALGALLCILAVSRPARAIVVSGRVVDSTTRSPIVGGTVSLSNPGKVAPGSILPGDAGPASGGESVVATTPILANGTFVLDAPAVGRYILRVQTPQRDNDHYLPWQKTLDVPRAGLAGQIVALEVLPAVHIRPIGPDGKPVAGPVETWTWILWSDHRASMQHDDGGHWSAILPAHSRPETVVKKAIIEVRCPEAGCGVLRLDGWKAGTYPVHLVLGSEIRGRAIDARGLPLAGLELCLDRKLAGSAGCYILGVDLFQTGEDGSYTVQALFPGDYKLRSFQKVGHRPLAHAFAVSGVRTDVILKPPAETIDTGVDDGHPSSGEIIRALFPEEIGSLVKVSGWVVAGHSNPDAFRDNRPDRMVADAPRKTLPGIRLALQGAGGQMGYLDSTVSGEDGSFTLLAPGPGKYGVDTWYQGMGSADIGVVSGLFGDSMRVRLPSGRPLDVPVLVCPAFRATIIGPDGEPADGKGVMSVWVLWGGHKSMAQSSTVEVQDGKVWMGLFRAPPARADKVLVEIGVDGEGQASVLLNDWTGQTPQIRLTPGGAIHGVVLDANGKPADQGRVRIFRISENPVWCASAQECSPWTDGRFTLSGLLPGTYEVQAMDQAPFDPKTQAYQQVEVGKDVVEVTLQYPGRHSEGPGARGLWDPMESDFLFTRMPWKVAAQRVDPDALRLAVEVHGLLVDRQSQAPVADTMVWMGGTDDVFPPFGSDRALVQIIPPVDMARSAQDGSFTLRAPAGAYKLWTMQSGFYAVTLPIDLQAGMKPLRLEMERIPAVTLKLLKPDGGPLAQGKVDVSLSRPGKGKQSGPRGAVLSLDVAEGGIATVPGSWSWTYERPGAGMPIQVLLSVDAPGIGHGQIVLDGWPTEVITLQLQRGQVEHKSGP